MIQKEQAILERIEQLQHSYSETKRQLEAIQSSRSYRLLRRLQQSSAARVWRGALHSIRPIRQGLLQRRQARYQSQILATLSNQNIPSNTVRIFVMGMAHPESKGHEVWLLAAKHPVAGQLDLKQFVKHGSWSLQDGVDSPTREALIASEMASIDLELDPDLWVSFYSHPWSGVVAITHAERQVSVDLYSSTPRILHINLWTGEQRVLKSFSESVAPIQLHQLHFTEADRAWIEAQQSSGQPLAIAHPDWRGIRSSTSQLFKRVLLIDDSINEVSAQRYARMIAEAECPMIVIQGFPLNYRHLVLALRRIVPRMPQHIVWHGTFIQVQDDYTWSLFQTVKELCQSHALNRWGFVKKGMAEVVAKWGFETGFVMNLMGTIPEKASTPLSGGPHVGIWNILPNWHKLPYEMIAAASTLPGVVIHGSGVNPRAHEFADLVGVQSHFRSQAIEQQHMPQELARMHLNMYVTFNECAPMLPLESLAVGVPCIFGPNTYYFEDNEYLYSRLVVPQSDNAGLIAQYMRGALEQRSRIIDEYRAYAPDYNQRARTALAQFLEWPTQSSE